MGGVCSAHREYKKYVQFWFESLNRRDRLEGLGIDGRIILKWILGKQVLKVWIGFIWLRTGTSGELL
jgi:hypothetical protein